MLFDKFQNKKLKNVHDNHATDACGFCKGKMTRDSKYLKSANIEQRLYTCQLLEKKNSECQVQH